MMYNYPFSSFPYFRRYSSNYNRSFSPLNTSTSNHYVVEDSNYTNNSNEYSKTYGNYKNNANRTNNYTAKSLGHDETNNKTVHSSSYGLSFLDNFFHQNDRSEDESYFDLFGLKLYNDDLLLIGLIFFLYKEDVKDQYLFFALILLLIS